MSAIDIKFVRRCWRLARGRNDFMFQDGVQLHRQDRPPGEGRGFEIALLPITSRGVSAAARIMIPSEDIDRFIDALRSLAGAAPAPAPAPRGWDVVDTSRKPGLNPLHCARWHQLHGRSIVGLACNNGEDHTMAMKAAEVKAWLATIPDDEEVAIDEGGLILETADGVCYCEIGGWPLAEDEEG